ncbi:hypothetical protein B0O80DRAFT_466061 [Mortierella sp. GBAus27b]|nr:hypothetical protein BGX31_006126 [Mortierella sp. GBA43]KAI8347089.1 hypothetical protein B0O80DRAFT_466061 [Mortierella sp. GBAus27b]
MATQTSKVECDCASRRADWDLHPHAQKTLANHESCKELSEGHLQHREHVQTEQPKATKGVCQCGKPEWDLHPAVIRKVENQGSDADRKHLHELEQRCPRAENTK